MECPRCDKEMECIDTTYSNVNTKRARIGQHTGDIYSCKDCGECFIDNFLTENLDSWDY